MNRPYLVAADVRRLTLSSGKRSEPFDRLRVYLVTSAATWDWVGFKAPMHVQKLGVVTLHEPN